MATRQGDRRTALRHQIEFILDNGRDEIREVIIKTGPASPGEDQFNRSMADAIRRRSLAVSPRDVLPPEIDSASDQGGPKARMAASASGRRGAMDLSLTATLAPQSAEPSRSRAAIGRLRAASLRSMRSVIDSEIIQRNLSENAGGPSDRSGHLEPRTFWASGSFLLRIREDDLMRLYESDLAGELEGVFPNRRIATPPHIVTKKIPSLVEDNKVSAWGVRSIGALSAWGAFGARGRGVKIGLLDTGVDPDHPDLKGKIAAWAEFDADGAMIPGSKAHDSDQHGTHCAGIMVGGNASGRWIGVAPDARIAAALVLDGARGGTDAQVLAGIDWAIEQKVDVINMSLGGLTWGPDAPSTYTSAILNALQVGIPVVTAIGNEGSQTTGSPGNDLLAFAVGATDSVNRVAGFSGGRTQVIRQSPYFPEDMLPLVYSKPDVTAPGVAIYSSIPGGTWEYFNGTSMAAPHVAGAIAILLSATDIKARVEPDLRASVLQDLMTGAAEELGEAGKDHRFGFGRVDVLRAIGFAKDLGY
ncbi:S8 family serine peptidase [Rubellimicrobium arenae]|uniref:S8 family serine peptidase n=1 Tax=Rubellimicrobium arenae TaxID=2817372 RepID=UPI001B305D90|nr:S8 family serine peptidase [Rubellimicrobium arenae]